MKFRSDKSIEVESKGLKLTISQPTPEVQAEAIAYTGKLNKLIKADNTEEYITAMVSFAVYCLKNCIQTMELSGEKHGPINVAKNADITDVETQKVMIKIATLVTNSIFISEGTKKK